MPLYPPAGTSGDPLAPCHAIHRCDMGVHGLVGGISSRGGARGGARRFVMAIVPASMITER